MRASSLSVLAAILLAGGVPAQSAVPQTGADSILLMTTLYRTAFANGLRTAHAMEKPALVCVAGTAGDPLPAVVAALADSTTFLVRPKSACRVEPLQSPSTGKSLVVDTLTGRRGIVITVTDVAFDSSNGFTFHTTYYENGRSGAYWDCRGRRTGVRWEVVSCRMTGIS
jgi:hypothetical protein